MFKINAAVAIPPGYFLPKSIAKIKPTIDAATDTSDIAPNQHAQHATMPRTKLAIIYPFALLFNAVFPFVTLWRLRAFNRLFKFFVINNYCND